MKTTTCRIVIGLALIAAGGGCATAMRGTTQKVAFKSVPEGAAVEIADKTYITPFQVVLKRNAAPVIVASKPGYESQKFKLTGKIDAMSMPQFALPGGSALLAADVASGGALTFSDQVTIRFKQTATDATHTEPVEMKEFRGEVYTQAAYDKAVAQYIDTLQRMQKDPNYRPPAQPVPAAVP